MSIGLLAALIATGCVSTDAARSSASGDSEPGTIPVSLPPTASHVPPFAWPLRGRVTSPFGPSKTRSHHAGIDIRGDERDGIRAAAAGRVSRVADNARYGLMMVIDHGGGYATLYAHTSALLAGVGDDVAEGQVIALVGDTGNAHGTHLHFEIRRNGRPVNPIPLLKPVRSEPAAKSP